MRAEESRFVQLILGQGHGQETKCRGRLLVWAVEESEVLPQVPDRNMLREEGFVFSSLFQGFSLLLAGTVHSGSTQEAEIDCRVQGLPGVQRPI